MKLIDASVFADRLEEQSLVTTLAMLRESASEVMVPFIDMLLDLASHLERDASTDRIWGGVDSDYPFTLRLSSNSASMRIWADYYDFATAAEKPSLHFRMQISRDGSKLTRDVRAKDPSTVEKQIRLAFGLRKT